MSDSPSSFGVRVPKTILTKCSKKVLKVIIKGDDCEKITNDCLYNLLKHNKIILDDDEKQVDILVIETKRKRYVYAEQLNYKHRQSIDFVHDGHTFSLLLIDPNDSRAELTLLHMPIGTNSVVIDHIFKSLNPKWVTSDIKHAPGDKKRGDRWELCVDCEDKNMIPDEIVLFEMGPEDQDITVKVFVSGRPVKRKEKANQSSNKADNIQSSSQTNSTPPFHKPSLPAPPPPPPQHVTTTPVSTISSTHTDLNSHANDTPDEASGHDTLKTPNSMNSLHRRPTPSPSYTQPPTKRADLKSLKSDDQTLEEYYRSQGISPTDVWLSRRQTNKYKNSS